ncbi:MAG TPA: hypothetical protein VHT75_15395 [Acidimicrobiales bacterium]|jgi:hypothetical protein|nr:hypothetical protein [Acidimicrobiales bacterium]
MLGLAPVHSLPWYFGVAAFAVWAAAFVGIALITRQRLRARAEGRRDHQRRRSAGRHIRDDRSLGSGTDIERRDGGY